MPPILNYFKGGKMTKAGYISNAAKMLAASAVFLLVANILVFIGSGGNSDFQKFGSSFSSLATYVVFFVSYIAFNGEGIGHKRARSRKAKKRTGYLKFITLICFLSIYFKGALRNAVLNAPADSFGGIALRLLGSVIYTVTAYAFLFWAVSLWYLLRDEGIKKLQIIEAISFVLASIYNFYKIFNYAVGRFELSFSQGLDRLFSNELMLNCLCIIQYLFMLIMFVMVTKHYSALSRYEEKRDNETNKLLFGAKNIFKDEGFGIDTLEDDFLTE